MSQSTMFALSFGGIWGLVGAVLFLVGWNISRDQKRRQKLCTQLAAGTVAEIHTRTHRRGQVAYYPVFTYFAEGQKYTVESSFAWYTSQFEPGDPVLPAWQPPELLCQRGIGIPEIHRLFPADGRWLSSDGGRRLCHRLLLWMSL